MSIITIPNDPIIFNPPPQDCVVCDPVDFCLKVNETDVVRFQIKQLPCGPNLLCDPGFNQASFNLITNGTFTGSAAGWTLGAGWTYAANEVSLNATPGHGMLVQNIPGMIAGKDYRIFFTISNVTGNVSLTPELGGIGGGATATGAGIWAIDCKAGAFGTDLKLIQNLNSTTFDIDDITLFEYSPCWSASDFWDLTDGAVHIPGDVTPLTQVTPPLTSGVYYRIRYTISAYTAGSVRMQLGTALGISAAANGDYIEYITANGTGFGMVPSSTFNGRVIITDLKALMGPGVNPFEFDMVEDSGGVITPLATITITDPDAYFQDFITVNFTPIDEYDPGEPYCFKILFLDQCEMYGDNLVPDPSFLNGSADYSFFSNWNVGFRQVFVPPADAQINAVFDGSGVQASGMAVSPLPGITKFAYAFKLAGPFPGDEIFYMQLNAAAQLVKSETTAGSFSGTVTTAPITSNFLTMFLHYPTGTEFSYLKDPSLIAITELDITYMSNCIYVKENHGCTKVITAYCRNNSFGRNYVETGYKPQMRIPIIRFGPYYPSQESSYTNSYGRRELVTSSLEKFWTLTTEMLPEEAHDFLALAKICTYFLIDGVEYRPKEGAYQPDWIREPAYPLAPVEFDVRKTEIDLFNNACS